MALVFILFAVTISTVGFLRGILLPFPFFEDWSRWFYPVKERVPFVFYPGFSCTDNTILPVLHFLQIEGPEPIMLHKTS
jgi:hypothetical protein